MAIPQSRCSCDSTLYTREPLVRKKSMLITSACGKQSVRLPAGCNEQGSCPDTYTYKNWQAAGFLWQGMPFEKAFRNKAYLMLE